jgi:hypothetical protein
MMPASVVAVEALPIVDLPPNPRAGTLKVDRARAVERCARLMKACPELDLDGAWRFVAGFELGRWRKAIGLEVSEFVARLNYPEDPGTARRIELAPCR